MAATPKAEDAEGQTQQSAVPTDEKKLPEETDAQEAAEETQETSETPAGDSEELELPKGVSERTKEQFEKLKNQLREYRQRLFGEQTFKDLTPRQQEAQEEPPLYDPKTGLVNVEALTDLQRTAKEAEARAARAEEAVSRYVEGAQTREAVSAYPELDPKSDKFDEGLYRATRANLMDSMVYPESYGGKQLSYKEAADLAKQTMGKKETPKENVAEDTSAKEAASLGASGRPTQGVQQKVSSEEEMRRLQIGTRLGDKQAMIERMRKIRESQTEASE